MMTSLLGSVVAIALAVSATTAPATAASDSDPYDYPTQARVDYVLGCMASNGQSQIVMRKCSCSIDYIAQRLRYDDYVAVETVKRMRKQSGERTSIFRDSKFANDLMKKFRRLQVKADMACF